MTEAAEDAETGEDMLKRARTRQDTGEDMPRRVRTRQTQVRTRRDG